MKKSNMHTNKMRNCEEAKTKNDIAPGKNKRQAQTKKAK